MHKNREELSQYKMRQLFSALGQCLLEAVSLTGLCTGIK